MANDLIGKDASLCEFCEALGSSLPAPGGGGAAALCAALGACLMRMVGSLTVGKKKYKDYEPEILQLMEACTDLSAKFLNLIEKDATGFLPLAAAYAIPKDDPSRLQVMEEAIETALEAPMEMLDLLEKASEMIGTFAEKGSKLAISDVGCAAALIRSAAEAAVLNIYINTKALCDRKKARRINSKEMAEVEEISLRADRAYKTVCEELKGDRDA